VKIERGDIATIVGTERAVGAAMKEIGYPDRPQDATDMVFVACGIVLGALIGLPTLALGALQLGLSTSVGVLLGGLLGGWLRSTRPTFGRIPAPTLWIFESLGLTGFVAVVGLAAGPDFVKGLRQSGLTLLAAGVLVAILQHLVGVLVGHHVFKMHPGILLGVCAGAGTATPALAEIQQVAQSPIPTLGYASHSQSATSC
jgi:putative transport protein